MITEEEYKKAFEICLKYKNQIKNEVKSITVYKDDIVSFLRSYNDYNIKGFVRLLNCLQSNMIPLKFSTITEFDFWHLRNTGKKSADLFLEICLENKINLPKWNEKKVLNNLKR